MKKLILSVFVMMLVVLQVSAKNVKNGFNNIIKESGINPSSIAISIKSADNGKTVYGLNEKTLMHPASVQKIITLPASVDKLGADYKFTTSIYSRGDNEFVIKLGADPYLNSKDLKNLAKPVKADSHKIYIDDSIMDSKTWGEGWQWDDDMNKYMPKFGAYNLDKNLAKITIVPAVESQSVSIMNQSKYPFMFINKITKGDRNSLHVSRDNEVSPNTIIIQGTVSRPETILIPINNLKRYFTIKLTQTLEDKKVYIKEQYGYDAIKDTDIIQTEVTHDISKAISDIYKNSNNMAAETVFKLAGEGSDIGGIKNFEDYCSKNKIDYSGIKIVDGSGVSKNNLMHADFISEYLILNKNNPIMEQLPHPGEGTLTERMLPIKDSLKAKTGTLSDISSIAGYLTSRHNKNYVFCIMINDAKLSNADKKMLEDYIIRELYLKG